MEHDPEKGAIMEDRRAVKLLPLAVTAVVLATTFGLLRVSGGRPEPGPGAPLTRGAEAVGAHAMPRELPPDPAARSLGGPTVLTRFDVSLLVLGGLGLIGFGLWVPGLVAATPFGGLPRLRAGLVGRRRSGVRYVPVAVVGVLLLTATGAFAQTQPTGSPYVGNPPDAETGAGAGSPPYVGTAPGEVGADLDAGAYVDALAAYVTPSPTPPAGTLVAAGRTLSRTPPAGEPAVLDAATESSGPVAGTPVTVGDMVALVLLGVAALLVVLVPRRRFP